MLKRFRVFLQMLILMAGSKLPNWIENLNQWIDEELLQAVRGLFDFRLDYAGLRDWLRNVVVILRRLALLTDTQLDDEAACLAGDLIEDDQQYSHVHAIVSMFFARVEDGQPVELARADAIAAANAAAINPATILLLVELAMEVIAIIKRMRG